MSCPFTLALSKVCVQCPIWLFSVVPWCRSIRVRCSTILFSKVPSFPLLLLALSCCHSTRAIFLSYKLYTLQFVVVLSWSHIYLIKLKCLLAHMFLFNYPGLRCPAFACDGPFRFHLFFLNLCFHDFFLIVPWKIISGFLVWFYP